MGTLACSSPQRNDVRLFFLVIGLSFAADATRIPNPADAVVMAAADSAVRPGPAFYVFLPNPSREMIAAQTYAANCSFSCAGVPQSPEVIAGGHLLRFDLRRWTPDEKDLLRVVETLASYDDPYFYIRAKVLTTVAPYVAADGKRYTTALRDGVAFGPHIPAEATLQLRGSTGLAVPIVYGPRWLGQSLRTLEGGLYYKLRGWDKLSQTEWLAEFGANEAASEALAGNSFAGKFRSNVTSKPRRGVVFFGVATRPTSGFPLVALTQDISDGQTDPKQHPIYSLLKFEFAASELIAVLPNGFPAAFLANAKGEIQTFVPPDIAKDHTIPPPHTALLEPLMSCGRCHGPDDFYKPFSNDVKRLLRRIDVYGDLGKRDQLQAVDEIAGKYSGEIEDAFVLARNACERACFRATGFGTADCWRFIVTEWDAYRYDDVTTQRAALELGFEFTAGMSDNETAAAFAGLTPPLSAVAGQPIAAENPVIASLGDILDAGEDEAVRLTISRPDWERVYGEAALRCRDYFQGENHEEQAK